MFRIGRRGRQVLGYWSNGLAGGVAVKVLLVGGIGPRRCRTLWLIAEVVVIVSKIYATVKFDVQPETVRVARGPPSGLGDGQRSLRSEGIQAIRALLERDRVASVDLVLTPEGGAGVRNDVGAWRGVG